MKKKTNLEERDSGARSIKNIYKLDQIQRSFMLNKENL